MSIRNTLLVLLFGGTLGGFFLREQQRGTLDRFDRVHREFLKANPATGVQSSSLEDPAIVFARMDDGDQMRRVFETWPLGEADWQVILQNLPGYAPRAVAIGAPLLFEKTGDGLEGAAKSVTGLSIGVEASISAGDGPQVLPPSVPVLKVIGNFDGIPQFKSIKPPVIGGAAAPREIDLLAREQKLSVEGDWCRVPMLARMGDKVVPTLALRALMAWANVPPAEVIVRPGIEIAVGKTLRVPIDVRGFFRYFLSLAPDVPTVNADDFVLGRDQALAEFPPEDPRRKILTGLKNSLLWFGPDDSASRLLKLPNGTTVSPAGLTARAIAAIQTDSFMRPIPADFQWIAPASTLLFCLWLTHWRKSRLWPGAFVAAVALVGLSLYLYRRDHEWLPLVPSLAILLATLLLSYVLPAPGWRRESNETPAPTRKSVKTQTVSPPASDSPPPERPGSTTNAVTPPANTETLMAAPPDPWEEAFSRAEGKKKGKKKPRP